MSAFSDISKILIVRHSEMKIIKLECYTKTWLISTEDDFWSLFAGTSIEVHFPFESLAINLSRVIIQFVFRFIYVMRNREQGRVIWI